MSVESLFLTASTGSLRVLSDRIGICLGKLTDDQIWARGNENENAVGNLVLHLCGNARPWIVSGLGGVPDIRQRDREFATEGGIAGQAVNHLLQTTMAEAIAVIEGLSGE